MKQQIIAIKRKVIRSNAKKKALPDPEFDSISWAIKARAPAEQINRDIRFIKIETDRIVATDGQILMIAGVENPPPPGCYDVLIATWKIIVLEKVEAAYPDYARVTVFDNPPDKKCSIVTCGPSGFSEFIYTAYQFQAYSAELLRKVFIPEQQITMEWRAGMKPLIIKAPGRTAVIMPLLIKKAEVTA